MNIRELKLQSDAFLPVSCCMVGAFKNTSCLTQRASVLRKMQMWENAEKVLRDLFRYK